MITTEPVLGLEFADPQLIEDEAQVNMSSNLHIDQFLSPPVLVYGGLIFIAFCPYGLDQNSDWIIIHISESGRFRGLKFHHMIEVQ